MSSAVVSTCRTFAAFEEIVRVATKVRVGAPGFVDNYPVRRMVAAMAMTARKFWAVFS